MARQTSRSRSAAAKRGWKTRRANERKRSTTRSKSKKRTTQRRRSTTRSRSTKRTTQRRRSTTRSKSTKRTTRKRSTSRPRTYRRVSGRYVPSRGSGSFQARHFKGTRPSPSLPAQSFCGSVRRGNDGNLWESREDRNGVCRWRRY